METSPCIFKLGGGLNFIDLRIQQTSTCWCSWNQPLSNHKAPTLNHLPTVLHIKYADVVLCFLLTMLMSVMILMFHFSW